MVGVPVVIAGVGGLVRGGLSFGGDVFGGDGLGGGRGVDLVTGMREAGAAAGPGIALKGIRKMADEQVADVGRVAARRGEISPAASRP